MNEERRHGSVLWMFSREPAAAETAEVDFDPATALYRLYRNTRNPYVQRAIAPTAPPARRTHDELARLFRFFDDRREYLLAARNTEEPYRRRRLYHPPAAAAPRDAYRDGARLPGDERRLPWLVDDFFTDVLERLRADPMGFDAVVAELIALFGQHRLRIRVYEAYYGLQDWDDLMDTLEEIARYPSVETFDLFCSALFAYYDMVHPPEGS